MRLLLLALVLLGSPLASQEPVPADAYADAGARELVRLARARRVTVDTRITGYQTTARERASAYVSVAGFEKLLFRRETVSHIDWTRDTVRIEVRGAREAQPLVGGGGRHAMPAFVASLPSLAFDPVDSEMLLRVDSTGLRHPLALGSEAFYRFSSGDTTAIRLPDGREVRLLELRIAARQPDPRLINGSFWVDADSHAVVRAVLRLSQPVITPGGYNGESVNLSLRAELDHIAIDYGLWDLRWWLPRLVSARGVVEVVGTRFPLAYERRYEDFRVEGDPLAPVPAPAAALAAGAERPCRRRVSVSFGITTGTPSDSAWTAAFDSAAARVTAGDAARSPEEPGCERAVVITRAEGVDLVNGPAFSGSVYGEGESPVSEEELEELARLVRGLPGVPWSFGKPRVSLLPLDMVRFNRVEGLSFGARAVVPLGPAELRGELRVGTTGEVGARLGAVRSTPALRAGASLYRGLEAVDPASQPFSLPASAGALLLGRDENDYFRATGAELRFSPPPTRPQWWDLRLFAERQEPVRSRSELSVREWLDDGFRPRANLVAEPLDQVGALLRLRGALGVDPARPRALAEVELLGEAGERAFVRPRLRLEADAPLGSRLGLGAGLTAGTGLGELSTQRAWQVGGVGTIRGHDAAGLRGESFWAARGEVTWGSPALRLSAFGDAGWAGANGDLWSGRPLRGVGLGASILDDLLRLDLARGIDGGGYRLYLRLGGRF